MHTIFESVAYIKPILEALYFLSGIILVIGVFIGVSQYRLDKQAAAATNRRAAAEKSIEYLTFYANSFIPDHDKYTELFRKEVPHPVDVPFGNFNTDTRDLSKEVIAELIIKQKYRIHDLLNKMEFFSVAILNGLADENLVYSPIAKHFCSFVEREHVVISVLRKNGAPYKNLLHLYEMWFHRLELLDLQKQHMEHKIKRKDATQRRNPPTGF